MEIIVPLFPSSFIVILYSVVSLARQPRPAKAREREKKREQLFITVIDRFMMTLLTIMDRSKNSPRQHKSNRCVQKFSNYWGEKQGMVGAGTVLPCIKVRFQTD
jgi:hypothetical protein